MSSAAYTHTNAKLSTLMHCALYRRTVQLSCRDCPHVARIDAVPLWWLFERRNWDDRLSAVPPHFYCSKCWHRRYRKTSRPRLTLTNDPPEPSSWAYPDERTWKRLVSRYRS